MTLYYEEEGSIRLPFACQKLADEVAEAEIGRAHV